MAVAQERDKYIAPTDLFASRIALEKGFKDMLGGYGGFDGLENILRHFIDISIPGKPDSTIVGELAQVEGKIVQADSILRFCIEKETRERSGSNPLEVERALIGRMGGKQVYIKAMWDMFRFCNTAQLKNPLVVGIYYSYQLYSQALRHYYRAFQKIIRWYEWLTRSTFSIIDGPTQRHFLDILRGSIAGEGMNVTSGERMAFAALALCLYNRYPEEKAFRLFDLMALSQAFGAITEAVSPYIRSSYALEEVNRNYWHWMTKYNGCAQPLLSDTIYGFGSTAQIRPALHLVTKPWKEGQEKYRYYAPWFVDQEGSWEIGRFVGDIYLTPEENPPIVGSHTTAALTAYLGHAGSGKTILMACAASWLMDNEGYTVFSPATDNKNQLKYAMMPLLPLDNHTAAMVKWMDAHGIARHGVPTLILDFVTQDEDYEMLEKQVLTKYDRIIEVEDPRRFKIDWNAIMAEHRRIAEKDYGGYKGGYIFVRNLKRNILEDRSGGGVRRFWPDIEVARSMLDQFMRWRRDTFNMMARADRPNMALEIDEVWYFAPATTQYGGQDVSQFTTDFLSSLIDARQFETPMLLATQAPVEVVPKVRGAANLIFFKELSPPELEMLVDNFALREPTQGEVIKKMINEGRISADDGLYLWPMWSARDESIYLTKPCYPLHGIDIEKKGTKEIYGRWLEEFGGPKDLFDCERETNGRLKPWMKLSSTAPPKKARGQPKTEKSEEVEAEEGEEVEAEGEGEYTDTNAFLFGR